jgi:hypothetical protein
MAVFLAIGSCALATWDDANGRGLIPYWQTGGNWYTLVTLVNGSEETGDVIYIRFLDVHDGGSVTMGNVYSIRQREMLIFSTTPQVPTWIPVSGRYGYIEFRAEGGGFIHAYCVIYNQVTGNGYVVPAHHQDAGF